MMPNTQLLSSHCSVPSLSPSSNWLLRDQYVIKKILTLNLKYSIVPAPAMEMNNIAAETRTVGQESSGGRWSEETAVPRENDPHGREMGWREELPKAVGSGQFWEVYRGWVSVWVTGEWV